MEEGFGETPAERGSLGSRLRVPPTLRVGLLLVLVSRPGLGSGRLPVAAASLV